MPVQMKLSDTKRDCAVFLQNGKFAVIVESKPDKVLCQTYPRHTLKQFFSKPCLSGLVDIYFVTMHIQNIQVHETDYRHIKCKAVRLRCDDGYMICPLLHGTSMDCI